MRTVVASANSGDTLTGYPATSNSQASSYEAVTVRFPAYNGLLQNEDQFRQDRQHARDLAATGIGTLLARTDANPGTDLLFAFSKAAAIYNGDSCRNVKEKDLIVLTDGFQQTPMLDVTEVDLSAGNIAAIIGRLKRNGYLPKLTGVKVWMVGCGADPHGGVGPEKLAQVRSFWLVYFRACGADLSPERYGTTLQNYGG